MDGIFWYGIPTLFRAEHDDDPANADIGLVGVPHSTGNGTTQRDQHLGPRAVRNVSAIGRRAHNHFGIDPWDMCRIKDCLLYTSPSPRDATLSRMPSSA